MSGSSESYRVSVNARELAGAWRTLKRTTTSKHRGELLMLYQEGELAFELGGAAVSIAADGTWTGQARLDSSRIFALLPHLPKHGSIGVSREGDRIRFETVSFPCSWDSRPTGDLRLPINPTLIELLWVSHTWARSAIESAGVLPLVEKAEMDRDARIGTAVVALGPLGVSEEDLVELVSQRISDRHG